MADIKNLSISLRTKKMILTGDLRREDGKGRTRSGRDMAILCSLIRAGYGLETARAVFLNKHLGCSDRILENGTRAEQNLLYDYTHAFDYIKAKAATPTHQVKVIRDIKALPKTTAEEKLRRIREYVVDDIFNNVGAGYKNASLKRKCLFDRSKKMLLDIGSDDFSCFLRDRYDLPEKDMTEVLAGVATKIWATGTEIEPFNFARYEDKTGVLYISNHDNSVFRLDGETIKIVDNGTDGVVFEYKPEYATIDLQLPSKSVNYFSGGFDWDLCRCESLLASTLSRRPT
jgi:hypothetical protein